MNSNLKIGIVSDILKEAIDSGSVLEIGSTIREGFRNNTLSEIQIEVASSTFLRLIKKYFRKYVNLLESRTFPFSSFTENSKLVTSTIIIQLVWVRCFWWVLDTTKFNHFILKFQTKWAMTESHDINKLKASVSSLASSFSEQTKLGTLSKRTLETEHVIPSSGKFPRMDLVSVYNKSSLVGDTAFSQMTFFLTRVFKSVCYNNFIIVYIRFSDSQSIL